MPDEAPLYHDLSDIDIDVDPYPASRRMSDEAPLYHDPPDIDIDIDPYPASRRMPDEAPPTTTSGLYYNEKYGFYALSRFDRRTGSVHGLADLQLSPRHGAGDHQERDGSPTGLMIFVGASAR